MLGRMKLIYSKLSNGNFVPGSFPVGSQVQTQWGPRTVVAVVVEDVEPTQEPFGV